MYKYKINEDLAEETGIHVGDGSMNIYKGTYAYTLACHYIDDKEYIDKHIIPLYQKVYAIKPKARMWSKGAYGFRIFNQSILEFKRDVLNLPLGKKEKIEIPAIILKKDNLKKAFLRGFVDTDGSINTFLANKKSIYPRIEMCNISKKLMNQINKILKETGFRTSIWTINKNHPGWNEGLRLTINGFQMLNKWKEEIGFNNPKHIKKLEKLMI